MRGSYKKKLFLFKSKEKNTQSTINMHEQHQYQVIINKHLLSINILIVA